MFAELVELGKRINTIHPALAPCQCDHDIIISKDGDFERIIPYEGDPLISEYIPTTAKKGKARFLVDNAEYTLECENTKDFKKNHETYLKKLNEYRKIEELAPVFSFFSKPQEVAKAKDAFKAIPKNKQKGNLTFMVDSTRLVDLECVKDAIIKKYEDGLCSVSNEERCCSVCGKNDYPIVDIPHGGVNMPGSDKKCSLVSYNEKAFESFNLSGNLNSGICTNCARNYVEALGFLTKSQWVTYDNGKKYKKYDNAIELSDDTLITFWTKEPTEDVDPFSDIYRPTEERIRRLFTSISTGDSQRVDVDVDNYFYCCTMSSAAARIAVRDWMTMSVSQYQKNLKQWFEDIATIKDDKTYYPGIDSILNNCIKKKSKPTQSDHKAKARIGAMLWHAALTNSTLPIMILQSVLDQIEHEKKNNNQRVAFAKEFAFAEEVAFAEEKSTVIRLLLNRNFKNKYKMKEVLDEQNESKAYLCGRLFALVCKLQFKAQGAVNSSIKDRFFASASNTPANVMGLLLTKYVPIYEKKTKGAYTKSITELAARIGHFPNKFTTIERGEFALGYYYQYNAKQIENNNKEGQL